MTPPGSAGHLYRRPIQYQPESVLLSPQLFPLSCIIIQNEKVLNERCTTKSLREGSGGWESDEGVLFHHFIILFSL